MPYDSGERIWKIGVLDNKGKSRGFLKLAHHEYDRNGDEILHLHDKRSWPGKPKPQHSETLLLCPSGERELYYLRIGFGQELTENDYAKKMTPHQAAAWLIGEGYDLPNGLELLDAQSSLGLPTSPRNLQPLTPAGQEVWDALEGKAMSAKELAAVVAGVQLSEDSIRKRIGCIRRARREIENRRGLGSYRPDSPPNGQRAERESG